MKIHCKPITRHGLVRRMDKELNVDLHLFKHESFSYEMMQACLDVVESIIKNQQ